MPNDVRTPFGDEGDPGRESLDPRFKAMGEEFQKIQKRRLSGLLPEGLMDESLDPDPLDVVSVSRWGPSPPPRLWLVNGLFPWGLVGMISGDGGTGKTLLMQQLLTCVAVGRPWLGRATIGGRALGFFGEDDMDDVHRRQDDINRHYGLNDSDFDGDMLQYTARSGRDNMLLEFDQKTNTHSKRDLFHKFRRQILKTSPSLVVLDTLAEIYSGNENVRTQASQFINAIKSLAQEADTTIILTAHPSLAGISSKTGLSGSTHWNNGVRARLYLTRPTNEDDEPDLKSPKRTLRGVKANFGATGEEIPLLWVNGVFIHAGQDPILANAGLREAEDYFLATLDKLTAQGRYVSESTNGGRYAPKIFFREPENPGFTAPELRVAMNNLFHKNLIKMEGIRGADRHVRPCIVRAEGAEGRADE